MLTFNHYTLGGEYVSHIMFFFILVLFYQILGGQKNCFQSWPPKMQLLYQLQIPSLPVLYILVSQRRRCSHTASNISQFWKRGRGRLEKVNMTGWGKIKRGEGPWKMKELCLESPSCLRRNSWLHLPASLDFDKPSSSQSTRIYQI